MYCRIENGEIRPLKPRNNLIEEEEEEEESVKSEREFSDRSESRHKKSSEKFRGKMENGNENSASNGNGLNTQHSLVGSSKTMDKDELNHIIPPSKKFPQVGQIIVHYFWGTSKT